MNKKQIVWIVPLLILIVGVSAVLLEWYGQIQTNIEVTQPIKVNGEFEYIETDTIEDVTTGDIVIGNVLKISNDADRDIDVMIKSNKIGGIETSYVGTLELTTKETTTWQPIATKKATVVYTLVGDVFNADIETDTGYELVYAMDKQNRFDPANYATVFKLVDIEGDLPKNIDWNANADPNYCNNANGFDNYYHCVGAKIWIVKSSDIAETAEVDGSYKLSWTNMNSYLYETDLIRYFDNTEGIITIPAGSYIEVYPQYEINGLLGTGDYTITTTIGLPQ